MTAPRALAAADAAPRTPIDIEHLLAWTYRAQRADVILSDRDKAPQGQSNLAAVVRILELGRFVDGGGAAGWHCPLHPDAEAVHGAVLALDRLGGGVHGLPMSRLVIGYARQALRTEDGWYLERPDPMAGEVPRPVPLLNARGKPVIEWADAGKRCGTCLLDYDPSPARIGAARAEYATWHAALCLLADRLVGTMRLWHPLPPALPAAPWTKKRVDLRRET